MKRVLFAISIVFICNDIYPMGELIPSIIFESLDDESPKETLVMRKLFTAELTHSGTKDYVAFYYSKNFKTSKASLYEKVIVYVVKNDKIMKRYNINDWAYDYYDETALRTIKEIEPFLGSWNGFFYQYDLNNNGVNEVYLFRTDGRTMAVSIYEFKNNRFIPLLADVGGILAHMMINIKEKSFTLYEEGEWEAHKKGYMARTYVWNSKKWLYELVEKKERVELKNE